ncbi:hypothetical protein I4F81_004261 [Pyropia yezoensis]|uniref:Uncharacterized protein n=1 Tax=Pyropia yezoensis TaxID=2788 RepID=A0ACC3BVA4_PYRYE|nr:hypothetical protein I4F81_004261 [Neopyropia yezoensis]
MARRRAPPPRASFLSALLLSPTEALTAFALTLMFAGAFYSHAHYYDAAATPVLIGGNVAAAVALLAAVAIREADRGRGESDLGHWAPLAGRLGLGVAVALTAGIGLAAAAVLGGAVVGHPATAGGVPFAAVVLVASLATAGTIGTRAVLTRRAATTATVTRTATAPATAAATADGGGGSGGDKKQQ